MVDTTAAENGNSQGSAKRSAGGRTGLMDFLLKGSEKRAAKLLEPPTKHYDIDFTAPAGDPGLFGPDSLIWRVYANPGATFIGGVTAVILELAEPRVRSGVWDHSTFKKDPIGRIRRTGAAGMATVYAPKDALPPMFARIRRMHEAVGGETPDGVAYQAVEDDLMKWVHITASYGFLNAYRRYVDPGITVAQQDQYYLDGQAGAKGFGDFDVPKSKAEVDAFFDEMRPHLEPHPILDEFLDIMLNTPIMGSVGLPVQRLLVHAAIDLCPEDIQDLVGRGKGRALRKAARPLVGLIVRSTAGVLKDGPVVHGTEDGPVLFLAGAVHGDEINGVEIIRRVLRQRGLTRISGTLIAVPIVNVLGFTANSRYLPDRRDLNRSFPGSETGSLAARLAHLVMDQLVSRADFGIDLHTAAVHRDNLPQIRGDLGNAEVEKLAALFNAPIMLNAALRPGSLREAANRRDVPVIVYEAGEALRFDQRSIRVGTQGVLRVMRGLGMLHSSSKTTKAPAPSIFSHSSSWVRSPEGGIIRLAARLGQVVTKDQTLGIVSDPFGERETTITAPFGGVVIGLARLPVIHQGDALVHIAKVSDRSEAITALEKFRDELDDVLPSQN
ncbi:doeB [Symbiodinium microadriaticum]|nr:doeB [Symbiodinium microadriaticum]